MDIKLIYLSCFFTVLISLSWPLNATVYKCVDDNGVIHYQSTACSEESQEQIMNVNDIPEVIIDEKDFKSDIRISKYTRGNKIPNQKIKKAEYEKLLKQQRKAQCAPYIKQYVKMKKQVKQLCNQNNETYCDLPGDLIEEKNYQRDLRLYGINEPANLVDMVTIRYNKGVGKIRKPPLLKLKELLKNNKCI